VSREAGGPPWTGREGLALAALLAAAAFFFTWNNRFPIGLHADEGKKVRFILGASPDFHHPLLQDGVFFRQRRTGCRVRGSVLGAHGIGPGHGARGAGARALARGPAGGGEHGRRAVNKQAGVLEIAVERGKCQRAQRQQVAAQARRRVEVLHLRLAQQAPCCPRRGRE
jgi:hypothetical protein